MRINISSIKNVQRKLRKIATPDATPLMTTWQNVIQEDNRRGILAGEDKDGAYMVAVSYRLKAEVLDIRGKTDDAKRMRNGARGRARRGTMGGFGPHAAGLHNNLSTREYQKLNGPPLAPRGVFSRVITNLVTSYLWDPVKDTWSAIGAWADVVDARGRSFLKYHFTGAGRLPIRDLRGVRPEGLKKARRAAGKWARDLVRQVFG